MKERPILFSCAMVRALLAGTKTQTRRAIKAPASVTGVKHFEGIRRVRAGQPVSEGTESAIRILRELEEREAKPEEPEDTAWTFSEWLLAFLTGATVLIGIAGVLFSVSTK